ncbi:MAG: phosphotransferase [Thermoanaerobaculia bacterium]
MTESPVEPRVASEIVAWLRDLGHEVDRLQPLAGDVSVRQYSRVHFVDGERAIAVRYPRAAREACRRYRRTTAWLEEIAVPVPRIRAADCRRGLMLLEDVGARTLYESTPRERDSLAAWFRQALRLADRISRLPPGDVAALNPPLDARLLRAELARTWTAFAEDATPPELMDPVQKLFDVLAARIAEETPRPCHRDFMVRNLVPVSPPPTLVVLDHQDLRLGPPLYDLASLLNDSLFLPGDLERELLAEAGVEDGVSRERFHRTAAQRTLKAMGTYAAAAAAGRRQHLPLLAPTLERALTHLEALPEGRSLAPGLRAAWSSRVLHCL